MTTQPRETQYILQGDRRSISQEASIYHFVRSMSMSFNFNCCFVDGQHNVLRETFTCRNPNVYSSKHAREYPHSRQVRTTTCILINNLCDFVHTYRRLLRPQLERGGSGNVSPFRVILCDLVPGIELWCLGFYGMAIVDSTS